MAEATKDLELADIRMDKIYSDASFNCRGIITPLDVVDLATSMQQRGLESPITVQPYCSEEHEGYEWRIVAGHRRHRAAQILEWETIPCIVKRNLTPLQARTSNLIENVHRKQLNILQEANALSHFRNAGLTQEDVAKMVDQSRGWVQTRFYLLDLPKEIQAEAAAGYINQVQIREIYSEPDRDKQYEMVKKIKDAKDRGEKSPKLRKVKRSIFTKRARTREEIFDMMEHIQEAIGNNFGTRSLAWASGEITDLDYYRDIEDMARRLGVPYSIPSDMMSPGSLGVKITTE